MTSHVGTSPVSRVKLYIMTIHSFLFLAHTVESWLFVFSSLIVLIFGKPLDGEGMWSLVLWGVTVSFCVHAHTESQSPSPVVSHLASVSHWSARVHSAVLKKKHKHLSRREISSLIHTQSQLLMEAFLAKQPRLYHPHTFRCDLGHLSRTIIILLYNSYYLP